MLPHPTAHVVNLCFHGIGTPGRPLEAGEDRYWITERTFQDVLDLVAGRSDVRLSFDDGNASDAAIGLPALLERGLTADFFVLAGRLDTPGSLSTAEVRKLSEAGMTVGSHGWHHTSWREARGPRLEEELVQAGARIASVTGVPVTAAACPLGLYDRRVLLALRRHGYTRVMTSDRTFARPGRWIQPRFSIRSDDDAAAVARLLRQPRRWHAARSGLRVLAKALR